MNKLTTLILSLVFFLSLSFSISFAQDDASSSGTNLQEIQKSLQERIKKAIKGENTESPQLKAFVGTISSIAENTIALTTNQQQTKHASISTNTQLLRDNKPVKLDSLKIGEGIIAMGLTTDFQTQDSLRIVLFEPTEPTSSRRVVLGTITKLDSKKQELTLSTTSSTPLILGYTSKSSFLDSTLNKIKLSSLEEGNLIIAIISTNLKKDTNTLLKLLNTGQTQILPSSPTSGNCGDGVCQNIVCQGIGCPKEETPETCPVDCTQ